MRVRRYNSKNSGIFFFAGVAVSLLLDLLGATPLAMVSLFGSGINILSFWFVPVVFAVVGIFIGIFTKENVWALVYAACFGQLQMWLPIIIYYFITHEGTPLDIWIRSLSGIILCVSFAGIASSIKTLIKNKSNKSTKK